jgi:hypothetical protein
LLPRDNTDAAKRWPKLYGDRRIRDRELYPPAVYTSYLLFRQRPNICPPSSSKTSHSYHSKTPSWQRDTQEYVLSPFWDVHAPPQKRYYNWTLTEISANPDGLRASPHELVQS